MSKGGIFLPHKAREPQRSGEVLKVGPGVMGPHGKLIEMGCKVGDKVIFGAYGGTEVQIDGEALQVMRDGDVILVIDAEAEVETAPLEKRRDHAASHYLD